MEAKTKAEKFLVELYGSLEAAEKRFGTAWGMTDTGLRFSAFDNNVGELAKIKQAGGKYVGDFWEVTFE